MSVILTVVQARAGTKVHLTPGEVNALWHLTQWIGRSFWHLNTFAQCVIAGVPSVTGFGWLLRWDPLLEKRQVRGSVKKKVTGGKR